ncbi:MAG: helix-hairpin-helix domain-containing protein [Planctomycetota bacterium]
MSNTSVAEFLSHVALLLDLKGENPFKVKSYRNAATSVDALEEEVSDLIEQGRIMSIRE